MKGACRRGMPIPGMATSPMTADSVPRRSRRSRTGSEPAHPKAIPRICRRPQALPRAGAFRSPTWSLPFPSPTKLRRPARSTISFLSSTRVSLRINGFRLRRLNRAVEPSSTMCSSSSNRRASRSFSLPAPSIRREAAPVAMAQQAAAVAVAREALGLAALARVAMALHAVARGGGPRIRGGNGDGGFISKWLTASVPGARPMLLPEGRAKRVPAGSRLVLQIHYTATGAPQEDQCSVGLVFADPKTVRKEVVTDMVVNPRFEIPPGDPNYKVEAERVLEQDEEVMVWMPHTHVRGSCFRYEAIYPDGKREVLLNVPHYDFSWQNTYVLAEPKLLPKGTTLRCEACYNNSASNLANPDPTQTVRWGEQTWEEMMIGYYDRTLAAEDRIKHPLPAPLTHVPRDLAKLDADLTSLAHAALGSQPAFDAFAKAVHERLPQVDRVCVTSVQDGNYVVQRSAYPGKKISHFAETGFKAPSRMVPLTGFALFNRLVSLPDLNALGSAPQMKMITSALKSSVHVPVAVDGLPSNVNFWSAQEKAFPEQTFGLLQRLAAEVVANR